MEIFDPINEDNPMKNPAACCGVSSKEKAIMGAAAPKPPGAIPPHSKLRGFLAFSHEAPTHLLRQVCSNPGMWLL
jgi:hypothetical protein